MNEDDDAASHGPSRGLSEPACLSTSRSGLTVELERRNIAQSETSRLAPPGLEIPGELLAHVSPLGWEHINLTGEYRWPGADRRAPRNA